MEPFGTPPAKRKPVSFAPSRLDRWGTSEREDTHFRSSTVRRCCLIAAVDAEKYRQPLLALERELVRKLEREVGAARASAEDQPEPGDPTVADERREACFTLAQSDSQLLTNVRGALIGP